MGLFDNPESKTKEIEQQRDGIKLEIAVKLYKKGYSDKDVDSILTIIEKAENEIQEIKDSLIGTNINPKTPDPMQPLSDGISQIRAIEMKMQKDLQEKLLQLAQKYGK